MEENVKALFELTISTFTQDWAPEKDLEHADRGFVATEVIVEACEEVMGDDVSKTDVSLWMQEHGFKLEWVKRFEGMAWIVWDIEREDSEESARTPRKDE